MPTPDDLTAIAAELAVLEREAYRQLYERERSPVGYRVVRRLAEIVSALPGHSAALEAREPALRRAPQRLDDAARLIAQAQTAIMTLPNLLPAIRDAQSLARKLIARRADLDLL